MAPVALIAPQGLLSLVGPVALVVPVVLVVPVALVVPLGGVDVGGEAAVFNCLPDDVLLLRDTRDKSDGRPDWQALRPASNSDLPLRCISDKCFLLDLKLKRSCLSRHLLVTFQTSCTFTCEHDDV